MSLPALRAEIDAIDAQLLALLGQRARLVADAWAWKAAHGVEPLDPGREAEILVRLQSLGAAQGLDPADVARVWAAMLRVRAGR